MIYNLNELKQLGFIPAKGYKLGHAFPQGFKLPVSITHESFKRLHLYIQVRYELDQVDGKHNLRVSNL